MPESEPGQQLYRSRWRARDYLNQYYATDATGDDLANVRFASDQLQLLQRHFRRALEVGCGPTVHHVAPFVSWVGHVTMADFLPGNLAEVKAWVAGARTAFDWDRWLSTMLGTSGDSLASLKKRLRGVIRETCELDLLAAGTPQEIAKGSYDLVLSYYCLECVGTTMPAWRECLRMLADFVAPGGVLFLGAMRGATRYRIFGDEFPVAPIVERDLYEALPSLGFGAAGLVIERAFVPEFAEHGFDQVLCVRAVKKR